MKIALYCAICLCVLLWLTACGAAKPAVVRTELIEVPIVQYAPLPRELTDPLLAPAAPQQNCRLRGEPAICALDGLLQLDLWQAVLDRANADRETARRIGTDAAKISGSNLNGRDMEARP